MNQLCSSSLDRCCARDQCTSARCLLEDIYPGSRMRPRAPGAGSSRNLSAGDWLFEERLGGGGGRLQPRIPVVPPTVICCCTAAEDCCCHRQQRQQPPPPVALRPHPRPHCPGHHPAAEEEEHMHCRYDTDLEHFIRAERSACCCRTSSWTRTSGISVPPLRAVPGDAMRRETINAPAQQVAAGDAAAAGHAVRRGHLLGHH